MWLQYILEQMGSHFGSECHKIDLQIPIYSNSHLFAKNLQAFLKLPFTKMKPARKTRKKMFFVTLRISRSKNVQNAYPRFGPKMREDCLSDSLHQWTFAIPSQFVFLKGMRFGFDSATKIDPDWKHKSHNTNVRVNVVFHCVLMAPDCSLTTTAWRNIVFFGPNLFFDHANKNVVFLHCD